jgi:hypothetical protein
MKKLSLIIALCGYILAGCSSPEPVQEKFRFTFNENGKFKIAQFTDLHWVHGKPTVARTVETIKAVLAAEKPDIAIITGDIVYKLPNREPWSEFAAIFEEAKTPFAAVLGNHDAEGGTEITRSEIMDILLRSPYFVGEKGPENIHGTGNYVIPVYGKNKKTEALLYCFDSNAYSTNPKVSGYDVIHFDQIEWYRRQSDRYTAANDGKPLPALAFFHIPFPEYWQVINGQNFVGTNKEDPCPPDYNTGLFWSILDQQDVMGVFVGHDHNNDYIGMLGHVALAYGRVSGWEAYGEMERGARIIELYENEFVFDTWISTPTDVEQFFNYPTTITSIDEETMTYLPAKNVKPAKHGVAYTYYEGRFRSVKGIDTAQKAGEGVMKNISILDAPAKDYFAYEFRTLIWIPERGVYSFYTISDDDSQIYIDGQLTVSKNWSSIAHVSGKVALDAGFHELKVLYYEDTAGQFLEVGYSNRKIRSQKLTDEILFLPE